MLWWHKAGDLGARTRLRGRFGRPPFPARTTSRLVRSKVEEAGEEGRLFRVPLGAGGPARAGLLRALDVTGAK